MNVPKVVYKGAYFYARPKGNSCYLYKTIADYNNGIHFCSPSKTSLGGPLYPSAEKQFEEIESSYSDSEQKEIILKFRNIKSSEKKKKLLKKLISELN